MSSYRLSTGEAKKASRNGQGQSLPELAWKHDDPGPTKLLAAGVDEATPAFSQQERLQRLEAISLLRTRRTIIT